MKKDILNQKIVIIPIEIKVRELIHKIYLTYKIIKNTKYSVILGGQRFLNNSYKYKDCIYIDKNTNPIRREKFPLYKKNKIIVLDEEGPVSFFPFTMFKERYYFKLLEKQISNYFFFGKRDFKFINSKRIKKKMYYYR